VCQINSPAELRIFKIIVKGTSSLNQQKRSVIESAILKT
jgi:hypothetical protein